MNTGMRWAQGSSMLAAVVTIVLLLANTDRANANAVYKRRDAQGHVAYQDHACTGAQQQTQIEIAKAPPPTPSPTYGESEKTHSGARKNVARSPSRHAREGEHEAMSYECRASNGEVFYRHSGCPKSVKTTSIERNRGQAKQGAGSSSVSSLKLSRSEACRRMAAGGSIGREGHQRDEQVSTYDRNAGRDPCR